jgi:phosphatidate cytidylyltransferase
MILNNFKKRFLTSVFLLFLFFLIFKSYIILNYCLIVLGVLSILEFLNLSRKILKNKLGLILLNIFFISYIFIFCFIFLMFFNNTLLKYTLSIILFGCIASDIGGFIFGKIFKGPKLTKISPNKTYSGAIGSIVLTLITVSILFYYFLKIFNLDTIILALVVSIFCQLGDLLFSLLKRKAKIKDTGNILPGHGGVLDRLDGIYLGIPVGILTLALLH